MATLAEIALRIRLVLNSLLDRKFNETNVPRYPNKVERVCLAIWMMYDADHFSFNGLYMN